MRPRLLLAFPALALAATTFAGMPAVGQRAPSFELPAAGGGTRSLAAPPGKRAVVLVFFRGVW